MKAPLTPAAAVLGARRRTGPLLVAALILHLLLVSLQVNTKNGVTVFDTALFGVLGELQRAFAAVAGSVGGVWQHYVALRDVDAENARLRAQLGQLEIRLQEQRALAMRGERLQALLDLRQQVAQKTLAAEIVAGDASAWFRTVTINRGTADGVRTDHAVISPRGIVGRVIDTPSAHAARVQLLVDRNAASGAVIERSRAGGVVVGDDGVALKMEYVSTLADVQVGDIVVSSGLDGVYPKGLVIGEVLEIEKGAGLYKVLRVKPAVDFSSIEEVLVVIDPTPIEGGAAPSVGAGPG